MEGVERIADLVGDTGGQKGQGLQSFTLDRLEGLLAGLGRVVQDEGDAGAALRSRVDRSRQDPQEARPRKADFEFVPGGVRAAAAIERGDLLPIEFGEKPRDGLSFGALGDQTEQAGDRLIAVGHTPLGIDDQHAVLDGVEERLEEVALSRQSLDHLLQVRRVEASEASEDLVEKTGFGRRHGPGDAARILDRSYSL